MKCGMENLDGLLRRVLPQVIPCPRSIALDSLQMVAMDFCKQSGAWRAVFDEYLYPCDRVISPDLPAGVVIENVLKILSDGETVEGMEFETANREIILRKPVQASMSVQIVATLRPLRTSAALPADILDEYGDVLVCGAIAKIKSMSGQKVEWNDPRGAEVHYQLYADGCQRAKARAFRRRFGSGIMYIKTEEA